jgi:hypothetical protein
MPQDFGNFSHRRAVTNHRGCQAVTKQMCSTSACGTQSRASESQADNMADRRRPRQANVWCPHSQEDSPGCAFAAIIVKVNRQCVTNVVYERHVLDHLALAVDNEFR